eukprot:CAMPEP_0168720674 /NCGR_PEP_ID=MMETSP0724-20121128/1686_1 /TAXON_ID=265536 /ORGANISM="Amphiprora sp., Strain CCMP467" /LENGTH=86 /DNA_ID=CAMNT_0008767287 /DNA_START=429 /DNA_END=685 /DNA_ORIENTATION=+
MGWLEASSTYRHKRQAYMSLRSRLFSLGYSMEESLGQNRINKASCLGAPASSSISKMSSSSSSSTASPSPSSICCPSSHSSAILNA